MENNYQHLLSSFHIIGFSYRTLSAEERGQFSVNSEAYACLLKKVKEFKIPEIFIVSTCNRTEFYVFGVTSECVLQLLCAHFNIERNYLNKHVYVKSGLQGIHHGFRVITGLESQILGDYEIVGQMKRAFYFSEERGHTGLILDRIFKHFLQAARKVRSGTQLSSGSVSLAYSAAQYIQNTWTSSFEAPKILVIGIGEIGRNAAINIRKLLPEAQLTLANRTFLVAKDLAKMLHCSSCTQEQALSDITQYDVILTAATCAEPWILATCFEHTSRDYIIVDLGIPNNVDSDLRKDNRIHYAHVDQISQVNDFTLESRAREIPKVELIIQEQCSELQEWLQHRKIATIIQELKAKLKGLESHLVCSELELSPQLIQKSINKMATRLKVEDTPKPGCYFLETYLDYLEKLEDQPSLKNYEINV